MQGTQDSANGGDTRARVLSRASLWRALGAESRNWNFILKTVQILEKLLTGSGLGMPCPGINWVCDWYFCSFGEELNVTVISWAAIVSREGDRNEWNSCPKIRYALLFTYPNSSEKNRKEDGMGRVQSSLSCWWDKGSPHLPLSRWDWVSLWRPPLLLKLLWFSWLYSMLPAEEQRWREHSNTIHLFPRTL